MGDGEHHVRTCVDCGEESDVENHNRYCTSPEGVCMVCGASCESEDILHEQTEIEAVNEYMHGYACVHCGTYDDAEPQSLLHRPGRRLCGLQDAV